MRISENPPQQNAPLLDGLVSEVTIIDPVHPLYGRTFPIVRVALSTPRKGSLVIQLPNGQQRSVLRTATDIDAPLTPLTCSVPSEARLSVRTLVSLARFVRRFVHARE